MAFAAFIPLIMGAMSAMSQQKQGEAQAGAANFNAAISRRNAQLSIDQGNIDAAAQKRKAVMTLGDARSLYGASGVTAEGSPLDVLSSSATAAEMDNQTIKYRARLRALGYQDTSSLDQMSASQYLSAGFTGSIGSIFQGAGGAYSSFGGGAGSGGKGLLTGAEGAGAGSSY